MGTKSQTVSLSQETLSEHLKKHPDIKIANYAAVQEIFDSSRVVRNGNSISFIRIENKGKEVFHMAIKHIKSTEELFLSTIHRIEHRKMKKMLKKAEEVIK